METNDVYLLAIFILSAFLGYFTVWRVSPSLHAPLMSATNAISGLTVLGGIVIAGHTTDIKVLTISLIAIFLASLNLIGGLAVTIRMLELFKKKESKNND